MELALTALATNEPAMTAVGPGTPSPITIVGARFPNTSRGVASFEIRLGQAADVRLALFDALGRLITAREPERVEEGVHVLQRSPRVPASGVFFLRVEAPGVAATNRWTS